MHLQKLLSFHPQRKILILRHLYKHRTYIARTKRIPVNYAGVLTSCRYMLIPPSVISPCNIMAENISGRSFNETFSI
jgi:hypothetical protein